MLLFWYVDAKGSLTQGTVKEENGKLIHEFQETAPDGKTANFVARVTPHGDAGWDNEILARKSDGTAPIVKVHYKSAK